MQNAIRRDRLAKVALVVVLAAAAPLIVGLLFPPAAPYVPPFALSFLVLLTAADILLLWRTEQVVEWIRPGGVVGSLRAKERRLAKVSAFTGIVVVLAFASVWVRSWS